MNIIAIFVLGILIGWLIEWVIDRFYWRGRIQALAEENERLQKEQPGSDDEVKTTLIREHKKLDEENSDLKIRLAELDNEINRIKAAALIGHLLNKDGTHNFQAIKGIGPAFAKRLNDSGIKTFEQLAQQTPQDMERILGTLYKRFFSKKGNAIPDQAKGFAKNIATAQGERKAQ